MRKLELKDIAAYLPYNLMVLHEGHRLMNDYFIRNINAVNVGSFTIEILQNHNWVWTDNFKPILRPMSDLTKSIVVKGYNDDKAFVPIVALAEKAFEIEIDAVTGFAQNGKCRGVSFIFDYAEYGFSYSEDTDAFHSQIISPKQNIITDNQSQLFDLLNQWHFDYRNLIAEGLAIDINTLKRRISNGSCN